MGDAGFLELLASAADPPATSVRARNASRPPFEDGLLGDPTGLDRSVTLDGAEPFGARRGPGAGPATDAYRRRPRELLRLPRRRRRNVIDRAHHGTLHQRAGEYVLLNLRRRSVDDCGGAEIHRGPEPATRGAVRDVQWRFAHRLLPDARLEGERVLDFGCGPGLFARLFARHGAKSSGSISTSSSGDAVVSAERDGVADRCGFRSWPSLWPTGSRPLKPVRFDRIFLSDVLMFYFHPYDPALDLDPSDLMIRLARPPRLPRGGSRVLEPNGIFWQQSWIGRSQTSLHDRHRIPASSLWGDADARADQPRARRPPDWPSPAMRELAAEPSGEDRGLEVCRRVSAWWFFELRRA